MVTATAFGEWLSVKGNHCSYGEVLTHTHLEPLVFAASEPAVAICQGDLPQAHGGNKHEKGQIRKTGTTHVM